MILFTFARRLARTACVGLCFSSALAIFSAEISGLAPLREKLSKDVQPILKQYCLTCHSTEKQKGDFDLERIAQPGQLLKHGKEWQMVVDQIHLGEMPPKDKDQPTDKQKQELLDWVGENLELTAQANAGDPGPVVLRRLNNAEYTFTIRDLTGVKSLEPAKEFPGDSAAGEGFMNTGNSLVMSPSLFTKYLDAGKAIAAHAVLLPDGFRFSEKTTRRDLTEETLAQIREIYRKYTDNGRAERVNLQGVIFDTNEGGRLPYEKYLHATIADRATLGKGGDAFKTVAEANKLNPKYLEILWTALNDFTPSLLLDQLRKEWREAKAGDANLDQQIEQWQKALWRFSSVGHIGKAGGPKAWMEPVNPLVAKQSFKLKLTPPEDGSDVVFYLSANDAGDGNTNDLVVWQRPRLMAPGRADLLLRDIRPFLEQITDRKEKLFSATAKCLAAAAEASAEGNRLNIEERAKKHEIEPAFLKAWFDYLGIGNDSEIKLDYFTGKQNSLGGYEFVSGWGKPETPSIVANASDNQVRIPGNLKGKGVAVHPSPTLKAAVGWKSLGSDRVKVSAATTHAHPECGNGVEWSLELRRGKLRQKLAAGVAQGGNVVPAGPIEHLSVQKGDLISLLVAPREGNHSCDLTDVQLTIRSEVPSGQQWNLSRDVASNIQAGNPHADSFGRAGVWHFYTEPVSGSGGSVVPAGSLLSKWQTAMDSEEKNKLGEAIQKLLSGAAPEVSKSADGQLHSQLTSLSGPLLGSFKPAEGSVTKSGSERFQKYSIDAAFFGKRPDGTAIEASSLGVQAPAVLEVRLPRELAAGAEFISEAILSEGAGGEGSAQLQVSTTKPSEGKKLISSDAKTGSKTGAWTGHNNDVVHGAPILVNENSVARKRFETAFDDFRNLFPPALAYVKIVPVDEVVTLTLYHREDNHLARLMLNDEEIKRLDRLWNEMHYISHDALAMVDVYEQLWQYATQDADPKVFEPMRKPIMERAESFRTALQQSEPKHLSALAEFAERAYRRPLDSAERESLNALYLKLRGEKLSHDEAFRLTLARLFVSSPFLYRLEKAGPGIGSVEVGNYELASRLSYFLGSSAPDEELLRAASEGTLKDPAVLRAQTQRMLKSPKVRRLATEFACAWLHIHDFDNLEEKSERHFPEFKNLRGEMYEESILFFTDLFQNDRSVMNVFDADYTFLNENLAKFYGIGGVSGQEWRKVDGVKKYSRGGVLGMSATLAKQSGASRTSPILRGNWVAEALLGEKLPRPPKDVPQLPEDEATENLTVRQLVEKHSSDPKCSGCHLRIDGYGFALEGFDAIGRARTKDLGARPIDAKGKLMDRSEIEGLEGLRNYLLTKKKNPIFRQFNRKLLGYALGRSVMLSDKPLLAQLEKNLEQNDYRFSSLVEGIVLSKQFTHIRGIEAPVED